jgi:CBS domain-containing protein
MQVIDVMMGAVETVDPDDSCQHAARMMRDLDVGCLVVAKGLNVEGVLTDRDLVKLCMAEGHDFHKCKVGRHMTTPVFTVESTTDLNDALRMMHEQQVRRLPVVDGGQLAGIVSVTDVVRSLDTPVHELMQALETSLATR